MQLSEDNPATKYLVTAYKDNAVVIDGVEYTHGIILTPKAIKPWAVASFAHLTDELLLELLCPIEADLVLVGTGAEHRQLSAQQLAFFYEQHIGIEVMSTQAACRTYNLLANEGRRVLAGLIM
ncbi:MAG TPA: Mth938-like domain-containing protein [Gammaproteobacteria bacterium]|nr:Mth938-like domain-containing protein [Gammaproteobacteria bacterium]